MVTECKIKKIKALKSFFNGAEKRQRRKLCDKQDKGVWETWEKSQKRERLLDDITKCEEAGVAVRCAVRSSSVRTAPAEGVARRETRNREWHTSPNTALLCSDASNPILPKLTFAYHLPNFPKNLLSSSLKTMVSFDIAWNALKNCMTQ